MCSGAAVVVIRIECFVRFYPTENLTLATHSDNNARRRNICPEKIARILVCLHRLPHTIPRWLGNCDYGFAPRRGTVPNGNGVAATPAVTPKRQSAAAMEEEGEPEGEEVAREREVEIEMEGVFEDAERHLKEAEDRCGEERWQG